jgi:hypothetical protein
MWYHFAFMAVSIAMFGMTVGALLAYLRGEWFPPQNVDRQLSRVSLIFAASLVPSFLGHLVIPFAPEISILGFYSVALTYGLIAIPFALSGVVVSLALTRFPRHVGALYAADLTGAAAACLVFVYCGFACYLVAVGAYIALPARSAAGCVISVPLSRLERLLDIPVIAAEMAVW